MKKLLGAVTFGQRVALGAAALLGLLLLAFVDLSPKVEGDFFFSSDDPQIQASRRIETTFRDDPQILVAVRAPRLFSRAALVRTFALTEDLASIDGVTGVYSVTHGPQETHDVAELDPDEVREEIVESPFWRRLLLSPDRKICFLVLVLDEKSTNEDEPRRHLIEAIDAAIDRHEARDFELAASGVPYVAEHIRADLTRDLKTFTIAAIVAFTALLWLLFRSAAAVFGTLTAALSACFATFLIRAAFGMSTGILTPNLWIIAFVLTLSHVVFLTASYGRQAAAPAEKEPLAAAVRQTGPASAWSLAANLCGFASLIFVEAKPLRDFGISGAIASAAALAAAYLVYPPFLAAVPPPAETGGLHRAGERFFLHRHRFLAALLIVVAFALVPFSRKVDTDPSLPSYLASGSEVRTGLEAIDRSGGSSTLELAVRDARGGALADKESFERLRALQADLEKHPDVGSVVSVALLMEELQRPWYSFLFSWEKRVEALEERRPCTDRENVPGREPRARPFHSQDARGDQKPTARGDHRRGRSDRAETRIRRGDHGRCVQPSERALGAGPHERRARARGPAGPLLRHHARDVAIPEGRRHDDAVLGRRPDHAVWHRRTDGDATRHHLRARGERGVADGDRRDDPSRLCGATRSRWCPRRRERLERLASGSRRVVEADCRVHARRRRGLLSLPRLEVPALAAPGNPRLRGRGPHRSRRARRSSGDGHGQGQPSDSSGAGAGLNSTVTDSASTTSIFRPFRR